MNGAERDRWILEAADLADLALPLPHIEDGESPEDAEDSPRDEALAVFDYGTTGWEERHPEPLDGQLAREEPDDGPTPDERSRPDADLPDAEFSGAELTEDDGWEEAAARDPFAGRLVQEDEGAHGTVVAEEVARTADDDTGGFSAEEVAVHVVSDQEI